MLLLALGWEYEIHMDLRPEEYIDIFSDSQADLEAHEAAKTTFPLVQQCQKAMNDISIQHFCSTVPSHWTF